MSELDNFQKLLREISERDYDTVILCGDFNCSNMAWGSDSTNKRGSKLYNMVSDLSFSVSSMPDYTRLGNFKQKNSVIDLIISNQSNLIKNISVGPILSDHKFFRANFVFSNNLNSKCTKVTDFHRSWALRSENLTNAINRINFKDIFQGSSLDKLPEILDGSIKNVWDKHGISKFVNKDSRPWFTPEIKQKRRNLRFWERKIKMLKRTGN